jgi:hypothetical protein
MVVICTWGNSLKLDLKYLKNYKNEQLKWGLKVQEWEYVYIQVAL